MASARTLSTAELGARRYAAASACAQWPVQIRLAPPHEQHQHEQHAPSYTLLVDDCRSIAMHRCERHDWRATFDTHEHVMSYKVFCDQRLIATGGLHVKAPQAPLTGQRATGALRSTASATGATQLKHSSDAASRVRTVRFVYDQQLWNVRRVFVRSDALPTTQLELTRHHAAFEQLAKLPVGRFSFRFVVIPRERVPLHALPYTQLGWDHAAMSDDERLVTWPIEFEVREHLQHQQHMHAQHVPRACSVWRIVMRVAMCVAAVSVGAFVLSVATPSPIHLQVQQHEHHDDGADQRGEGDEQQRSTSALQHALSLPS
eukprot:TRINITY_DN200_c0_g2_i4.p1 TRINITY_DN200_c0_g2~~TRINITY_DN200_c0_g2_i4.p1  ORF type:complete len:317 (-),score=71.29 TRINITY_DN200_c0_g2_i4:590-1540(-)